MLFHLSTHAQEKNKKDTLFTMGEEMPEPEGGITMFYSFIGKNIQNPSAAKNGEIAGKVFMKFVVEADGSLSNIEVLKGLPGCEACNKEAERVLLSYPSKWKPGKQAGKAVRVSFTIPIAFRQ